MKKINLRIREADLKYCEDLAESLDRSTAYVIRALLEEGIILHRNGKVEF